MATVQQFFSLIGVKLTPPPVSGHGDSSGVSDITQDRRRKKK
jgi:hypothetical protein